VITSKKGSRRENKVATKAKRRGRPFKAPKPGKRAPLSLLVRAEIKKLVDERAKASGRTQSQEAEMLIERCLQYESVHGTDSGAVQHLLWRHGYTRWAISNPRTGQRGFAWFEPGVIEESGFVPADEMPQQEEPK
jgi:hypothetical protein